MLPQLSPGLVRALLILLAGLILISLSPNPTPALLTDQLSAIQASLQGGDPQSALEPFAAVLRLEPSLGLLHRPAAHAALASGSPSTALAHIEQALQIEPGAPDLECMELEALAWGDGQVARTPIPPACQGSATLHRTRAQSLIAGGDFYDALEELEISRDLEPKDPESLRLRAILSAALDPAEALEAVLEARRIAAADDPLLADLEATLRVSIGGPSQEVALRMGQVFLRHDRWDEARVAFQRAADLAPADVAAQSYLAYAQSPADPEAIDRLRAIRLANPDVSLPYLLEAMALRHQRSPSTAIPVLEAGLALEPANPALMAEMGAAQLMAGDLPQAARWYRLAAETARTDPAYWRLLAQFSLDHGFEVASLALPAARNAVALEPSSADAWDQLGHAHLTDGDPVLADRSLRTSIRLDPHHPAAHYHFGLTLVLLGDPAGARAAFDAVLRIDPEGVFADLARRSLDLLAD